jgi:hypothetical protein
MAEPSWRDSRRERWKKKEGSLRLELFHREERPALERNISATTSMTIIKMLNTIVCIVVLLVVGNLGRLYEDGLPASSS